MLVKCQPEQSQFPPRLGPGCSMRAEALDELLHKSALDPLEASQRGGHIRLYRRQSLHLMLKNEIVI